MTHKITMRDAKYIKKNATVINVIRGKVTYELNRFYRLVNVTIDSESMSGNLVNPLTKEPESAVSFYDVVMTNNVREYLF